MTFSCASKKLLSCCAHVPRLFRISIALVTLLGAVHLRAADSVVLDRPNVILLIADDMSWDDLGCSGSRCARTPRIDAIAATGLRFTNAFLTASSCSPSRASIMTSRYPHNLGRAAELHEPIPAHIPWLASLMHQAGYFTALVGKNHMTSEKPGSQSQNLKDESRFLKPWNLVFAGNLPDNSGGHGQWVETLRDRPKEKPFFGWFASFDAHREWEADDEWNEVLYGPKHLPEEIDVPVFLVDDDQTRQDLASYHNEVTRFDYFCGQVMDELTRQNVLENTLVFVLSDNGRPFPRSKTRLHDSGMKTALVATWPRGIPGTIHTCESLVSSIDLAPTILEAAGVSPPKTFQGLSMLPLFRDPHAIFRTAAFSEHNWHDYEAHGRSVRSEGYLYIRNSRTQTPWQGPADSVRSKSHASLRRARANAELTPAQADVFRTPRPAEELYRVADDPDQLHSLSGDPSCADVQQRLSHLLDTWIEQTGDSVPENLSADRFDRETGRSLGRDKQSLPSTVPGEDRRASHIPDSGPR